MQYEHDGVTIDATICNGKPTITGHRITVQTVLEFLSAGDAPADILECYSSLTAADIAACLRYAARSAAHSHRLIRVAA